MPPSALERSPKAISRRMGLKKEPPSFLKKIMVSGAIRWAEVGAQLHLLDTSGPLNHPNVHLISQAKKYRAGTIVKPGNPGCAKFSLVFMYVHE
jgi:hypothetical protein